MTIPVFVVTGFLDAGKTSFLNSMLNRREWKDISILILQFETGEAEFQSKYGNCVPVSFSKKELEQQPEAVAKRIDTYLKKQEYDEIWVEWNGVTPFSQLQTLLLSADIRAQCKIYSVIHVADALQIENLLGKTGSALPEQIVGCDIIAVRNTRISDDLYRLQRMFRGINPGVPVCRIRMRSKIDRLFFRKRPHPTRYFICTVFLFSMLYLLLKPYFEQTLFNTVIIVFLGIILQAIPFLLIGVLLSSVIQIFVPREWIGRRFPKSLGIGMVVAVLAGFCLPVCDCASVPVFRSLVKKGVPLPVAVTFMMATPVINPVAILSTYYAFSGNMTIVLGRVSLGMISAVLIGLIVGMSTPERYVLTGGTLDRPMCSCGCYEDGETTSFRGKVVLFLRHSQAEFFDVGKYLMIGTLIASVFQAIGTGVFTKLQGGSGLAISIAIMMVMAFTLSLCSSSDAVIARSFANQFPIGALMGFLVFGPMIDIKNILMLSSGFSCRFTGRLLLTTFIICFVLVFAVYSLGVL